MYHTLVLPNWCSLTSLPFRHEGASYDHINALVCVYILAKAALVCCSLYGFRKLRMFLRTGELLSPTMSEDGSTSDDE